MADLPGSPASLCDVIYKCATCWSGTGVQQEAEVMSYSPALSTAGCRSNRTQPSGTSCSAPGSRTRRRTDSWSLNLNDKLVWVLEEVLDLVHSGTIPCNRLKGFSGVLIKFWIINELRVVTDRPGSAVFVPRPRPRAEM